MIVELDTKDYVKVPASMDNEEMVRMSHRKISGAKKRARGGEQGLLQYHLSGPRLGSLLLDVLWSSSACIAPSLRAHIQLECTRALSI